jgi:hypothetical protein
MVWIVCGPDASGASRIAQASQGVDGGDRASALPFLGQ